MGRSGGTCVKGGRTWRVVASAGDSCLGGVGLWCATVATLRYFICDVPPLSKND
jgi:hypothetical protein